MNKIDKKFEELFHSNIHKYGFGLFFFIVVVGVFFVITGNSHQNGNMLKAELISIESPQGLSASFENSYEVSADSNSFTISVSAHDVSAFSIRGFELSFSDFPHDYIEYSSHDLASYITSTWIKIGSDSLSTIFDSVEPSVVFATNKSQVLENGHIMDLTFLVPDVSIIGEGLSFGLQIEYASLTDNYLTNPGNIILNLVNQPPVIDDSSYQSSYSIDEDSTHTLNLAPLASDPDGDDLTWSFHSVSSGVALESYYIIHSSSDSMMAYLIPEADENGSIEVVFKVSDSEGASDQTGPITFSWDPVNDPPVIDHEQYLTNYSGTEDYPIMIENLQEVASDVDGDSLIWSILSSGTGIHLTSYYIDSSDATNIKAVFIPEENAHGTRSDVVLSVTDSIAPPIYTSHISLEWEAVNDPPEIISNLNAGNTTSVMQNEDIELLFTENMVIDPDNDYTELQWQIVSWEPSGAIQSTEQPSHGNFMISPVQDFTGPVELEVTISDLSGLFDTGTLTVNWTLLPNQPPEWTTTIPQDYVADEDISIIFVLNPEEYAEDPNPGDLMSWSIPTINYDYLKQGTGVFGNTFTFIPKDDLFTSPPNNPGEDSFLTVEINLCDTFLECISEDIFLTWNSVNDPPIISENLLTLVPETDRFKDEGEDIILQFDDTMVFDVDSEVFTWSIPSYTPEGLIGSITPDGEGGFVITPMNEYINGTVYLNLQVSDGDLTDDFQVPIGWNSVNNPPELVSGWQELVLGRVVPEGQLMTLSFNQSMVNDPDGDIVTFIVSKWDDPLNPVNDIIDYVSNFGQNTYTIHPYDNANGITFVWVTIDDGNGGVFTHNLEVAWSALDDPPVWVEWPGKDGIELVSPGELFVFNLTEAITDPDTDPSINFASGALQSMGSYQFVSADLPSNAGIVSNSPDVGFSFEWTPDEITQGGDLYEFSVSAVLSPYSVPQTFSFAVDAPGILPLVDIVSATATSNTVVAVEMNMEIDASSLSISDIGIVSPSGTLGISSVYLYPTDASMIMVQTSPQSEISYLITLNDLISEDLLFSTPDGGVSTSFVGIAISNIENEFGNCNGDHEIKFNDVLLALSALITGQSNDTLLNNCDLNNSGLIDMNDVLQVYEIYVANL